jgi:hypothetical protein
MFAVLETVLSKLVPSWAKYRKEQELLAPLEEVIRADNDVLPH